LDTETRCIGFIGEHHFLESIRASVSEAELTSQIDLEFQGNVVVIYEIPISQADNAGLDPEIMGKSDTSIDVAEWKTGTTNDTAAVEYTTYFYWKPPSVTEIEKTFELRRSNTTFSSEISKRSHGCHTDRRVDHGPKPQ
jgi:hypothetical protein